MKCLFGNFFSIILITAVKNWITMNNKNKKSKNKTKSSDDNSDAKPEKKVRFRDSNIIDNSKKEEDEFQKKELTRRRKHTKVSKKSKLDIEDAKDLCIIILYEMKQKEKQDVINF